jgi:hypothetical protein
MKTFKDQAAQGDIFIRRIHSLPDDAEKNTPDNGQYVVAHSETGHHHTIEARQADFYTAANDPMIMYLVVSESADLIHNRSFDKHDEIRLDAGIYEIRRQREHAPEGWRRVAD